MAALTLGRVGGIALFALSALLMPTAGAAVGTAHGVHAARAPVAPDPPWLWPVDGARLVTEPFLAPAHEYGAGHRGIDLTAPTTGSVRAPADGVVAFRGVVVDRPLVTIEHGDGMVTTFEPVDSVLSAGTAVRAGDLIGQVAVGGHAETGTLHLGVRWDDVYINPMSLFGEVPSAILLPCCS